MSVWDDLGEVMQPGDIIRLTKGYATLFRGCLTLYSGTGGKLHKVGEFCMVFSEFPNMSEPNPEFIAQQKIAQQDQRSNSPTGQGPGQSSAENRNTGNSGQRPGNNGSGQGDFSGQAGRPPTPPVGGGGAGFSQSSRGGLNRGGMTRGQPSNNGMMGNYANDMRGRNRRGR
ncbi:SOSS complex subunit B2-like isoform X4 [Amphiura filiformis]